MFKAMILTLLGATFEVRVISPTTGKDIPGRCLFKGKYRKARKAYLKAAAKVKVGHTLRLQAVTITDSFTKTGVVDEYLLEMWRESRALAGQDAYETGSVLPGVSRELHESAQAAAQRLAAGIASESELQVIRECLSQARQAEEGSVQEVRGAFRSDAPRGLQQASGSDVVVPSVSLDPTFTPDPGLEALTDQYEAENPLEDIKSLYQGEDLVDPARPRTHECNVQGPLEYDSNAACYVPTCDVCGRLN